MTEKWVAVHCGTKRDIERGRDFYRIGPEMDVSDPDCSCPTIPQKWRADQLVDGINAALATKDAEIERLRKAIDYYEIGCTAVGVPHEAERKILHDCVKEARKIRNATPDPAGRMPVEVK